MADEKPTPGAQATADRQKPGPDDQTLIRPAEGGEELTPSRQQRLPYAVVVDGPRMGARFSLSEEHPNIIGRAPGNAIRLEDQSVSRQHAEIAKGASGWTVRDLGSKNGTGVNGKPITDTVVIGHKDVVKTGIYQLRLITQPIRLEEEMTLPPEIAQADRTVFVAAPPDGMTAEVHKREVPEEMGLPPAVPEEMPELPPDEEGDLFERPSKRRQFIMLGALGLVAIVAIAWLASRLLFPSHKTPPHAVPVAETAVPQSAPAGGEAAPALPVAPPVTPPPAGTPGAPPPTGAPVTPPPSAVATIPVFLDIASSPLPAKITFQDKELGTTPLRVNVELEPGRSYAAQALFAMPEIGQQFAQTIEFTVQQGQSIIPILFRGPIGILKVMSLPRDVQFYLEGKFSYDKHQEQSAKLSEIVLQKPIYIPFGTYMLELRRAKQLGSSSPTYLADIIFHRDFTITEDNPTYTLEVKEEDLQSFPVKIRSDPSNADVFIDGKLAGKTPYEGIFPLGEHKLTVTKEGYFEHGEDLKVDINTPFLADIQLKTSVAGAHINNARQAMNRAMFQDAINELAEALGSQPAPSEAALAQYLLGVCYLRMNDLERAMGYFEQARASETQRYPAMLGLANAYAIMNRVDQALPLLVEVLLKAQDDETKREAHDLFQKMSPFRSVIYIYSDPPGATVTVNDKPVAQQTPLILHELPLGNYRVHIEKTGYLPSDLNLSLSVNEFNPIIVKLKPIPQ